MTVLVDTNIVIALLDDDNFFHGWATEQVASLKASSPPLIVPDIVYCEVSVAMEHQDQMDQAIAEHGFERLSPSDEALFRAGKAYRQYKDLNNGPKLGVLPDYLIGAMAEVLNIPLLTANPKDFVGYFPDVVTIQPPDQVEQSPPAAVANIGNFEDLLGN
ncbi:type II toxin-antitoxin system VapC family toxin [Falsirhodobacter sp. 1013]|uniref:type II toxin-antitoxin system VapC family toxin n=1 Tax=Falsirhodobacter sp. 1013 TaxID=3417566 RepID=UPI003EB6FE66